MTATPLDLDTPAALVDVDAMERNIARIAEQCRRSNVAWRPHVKSHKTIEIARIELDHGAIGVTCAKLGEAEVLAQAGLGGILIANQIVGTHKMARLAALRERSDIAICIDSQDNVDELEATFAGTGRSLRVAIEVNTGMNRAGVLPDAVLELSRYVQGKQHLSLCGVMTWESHALAAPTPELKRAAVEIALARLASCAADCRAAGIPIEMVSAGGTGTFPECAQQPGITEIQVGGGIFGDEQYRDRYGVDFEPALLIATTVISRPTPGRVILDAGRKAMSGDAAMPVPIGLPPIQSVRLSAEHTTIELKEASELPRYGDQVLLRAGYSDTTIHLHETLVALRGGTVAAAWPVAARGRIK